MSHLPAIGGNILYYASPTEVQTARITWVNPDNSVSLVAFPPSRSGSNFQARENVAYGPGEAGKWGWNEAVSIPSYTAEIDLSGHRVVMMTSDKALTYADCTKLECSDAVFGMTISAAIAGKEVSVINHDLVSEPSWNWQVNKPLFLYRDGLITQDYNAVYAIATFILLVGIAIAPDTIFFSPKTSIQRG